MCKRRVRGIRFIIVFLISISLFFSLSNYANYVDQLEYLFVDREQLTDEEFEKIDLCEKFISLQVAIGKQLNKKTLEQIIKLTGIDSITLKLTNIYEFKYFFKVTLFQR
jgi:hypothetical protein